MIPEQWIWLLCSVSVIPENKLLLQELALLTSGLLGIFGSYANFLLGKCPFYPFADTHDPHYEKDFPTALGKPIMAKRSHHGWLNIDDVIIAAKSDFCPPKFSLVAALGVEWCKYASFNLILRVRIEAYKRQRDNFSRTYLFATKFSTNVLHNRHINPEYFIHIDKKIFELRSLVENHLARPRLQNFFEKVRCEQLFCNQTWGDYSTNVIDCNYLPLARLWLRLRINKITM